MPRSTGIVDNKRLITYWSMVRPSWFRMFSISSGDAIWPASTWARSPGSILSMKKSRREMPMSTGIVDNSV